MLKVRAVQMDMVRKFAEVCEKHRLPFWMDGGTLLGAVRHKGYIPWDDDIDLIMLRKDYDKLNKIASEEFTHPYFWQTTYTEHHHFCGHAQIRNVETSAFGKEEMDRSHCKGIFVDVFVYDGVPGNAVAYALHRMLAKTVNKLTRLALSSENERLMGVPAQKWFSMFESVYRMVNAEKAERIGLISFKYRHSQIFHRCHYRDTVMLDFENMKLPAPGDWHGLLCEYFGEDYMTPKKIVTAHGEKYMDAERPYTETIPEVKARPELFEERIIKVYGNE